jgi:hypothetical protein
MLRDASFYFNLLRIASTCFMMLRIALTCFMMPHVAFICVHLLSFEKYLKNGIATNLTQPGMSERALELAFHGCDIFVPAASHASHQSEFSRYFKMANLRILRQRETALQKGYS